MYAEGSVVAEEDPYAYEDVYTEEDTYAQEDAYTEEDMYEQEDVYAEEDTYEQEDIYAEEDTYEQEDAYTEETYTQEDGNIDDIITEEKTVTEKAAAIEQALAIEEATKKVYDNIEKAVLNHKSEEQIRPPETTLRRKKSLRRRIRLFLLRIRASCLKYKRVCFFLIIVVLLVVVGIYNKISEEKENFKKLTEINQSLQEEISRNNDRYAELNQTLSETQAELESVTEEKDSLKKDIRDLNSELGKLSEVEQEIDTIYKGIRELTVPNKTFYTNQNAVVLKRGERREILVHLTSNSSYTVSSKADNSIATGKWNGSFDSSNNAVFTVTAGDTVGSTLFTFTNNINSLSIQVRVFVIDDDTTYNPISISDHD